MRQLGESSGLIERVRRVDHGIGPGAAMDDADLPQPVILELGPLRRRCGAGSLNFADVAVGVVLVGVGKVDRTVNLEDYRGSATECVVGRLPMLILLLPRDYDGAYCKGPSYIKTLCIAGRRMPA